MAELIPVAGAKIYIGDTTLETKNTDFAESDFDAQSWTEIDGWENMGGVGDEAEIITTNLINRNRAIKQKGTRDAGTMENQFAILRDDTGQQALIAAEATNDNYAFKIEFDDSAGVNPTTLFFIGLVTNVREVGGSSNTVQMMNGSIAINSNIVTKAAA
jgi:uncharacterized protein YmfQ (DUF2313 family)